jgi:hypothetical protein
VTTAERWARIERLYHDALQRDPRERGSFLADACAGDESLRLEVESLLAHDGGAAYLSTPALVSDVVERLQVGQTVGPYLISARIGEGGMGEVYRARDTKLGRDVAIKVVSGAFTADSERLARFAREARVLASLNHPHIGAIYGLEESDGVRALVRNWSKARPSPTSSRREPACPYPKPWRSRGRSPARSMPRTSEASSIAI